jgi:hypothetical protein
VLRRQKSEEKKQLSFFHFLITQTVFMLFLFAASDGGERTGKIWGCFSRFSAIFTSPSFLRVCNFPVVFFLLVLSSHILMFALDDRN